ncbi:hypothetical protein I4U23_031467 [Adineta vaga]|nr:hypothetical protein I4U23_031467 [Adineta vaga]
MRTNKHIQRGDINQHEGQCINQTISCTAFDIKCPWKGTRKALAQHLQECPFEKIRPAIDDIYESLRNVYDPLINEVQTIRQQLEQQVQRNRKQNHFLLAVFNEGKPMSVSPGCSDKRVSPKSTCRTSQALCEQEAIMFKRAMANNWNYNQSPQSQKKQPVQDRPKSTSFLCASCHDDIDFDSIALHHCEGGCICKTCVRMYGSLDMN